MRKILSLALLVLGLASAGEPVWAQATADQLNKLSLEALTAPPPPAPARLAPARRATTHWPWQHNASRSYSRSRAVSPSARYQPSQRSYQSPYHSRSSGRRTIWSYPSSRGSAGRTHAAPSHSSRHTTHRHY